MNLNLLETFLLRFIRLKRFLQPFLLVIFSLLFIHARAQTATFKANPKGGIYCAPAEIQFVPTFSEKPLTFFWEFGLNGEESDLQNPTFTYTIPGNYKVTLNVLFENSFVKVDRNIQVFGLPSVGISPNTDYLCKPGSIEFTSTGSSTIQQIQWDLGEGTFTSTNGLESLIQTYNNFGVFRVVATAVDNNGCKAVDSKVINIMTPPAVLLDTALNGCLPVSAQFTANVSLPPGSTVIEYKWNAGDGSPVQTTTSNTLSHIFTDTITHKPSLTITTSEGCTGSYQFHSLAFANKPKSVSISTANTTICASDLPYFFVAPYDSLNHYTWLFGDGDKNLNVPDSFSFHQYASLGTFNVQVVPKRRGCYGDTASLEIKTQGVVAGFRFQNDCTNRSLFNFRNNSRGVTDSISWSFGDGTTQNNVSRLNKQYPSIGTFPVKMIVYNQATNCADTIENTIFTAVPKLLAVDSFICRNNMATIGVRDTYANRRATYRWELAGKRINNSDSMASVSANNFGVFTNSVIINNGPEYCNDTLVQLYPMVVRGPIAAIGLPNTFCIEKLISFTDLSSPYFNKDSISAWNWDLGNGTFSNLKNPPSFKYASSDRFLVTLSVKDLNGCEDSDARNIKIRRRPLLSVSPQSQKICAGQSFTLYAFHNSDIKWFPAGSVSCDTCDQVTIRPSKPSTYMVLSTDEYGCQDEKSIFIDTWMPFSLPVLLKDTAICIGNSVVLDVMTTDKMVTWSPSSGMSNIYIPNPTVLPGSTTTYTATVSDSAYCFFHKTSSTVQVNPLPQVNAGQDFMIGFNKPFILSPTYGPDIVKYEWTPASLLNCSDCSMPTGTASISTTFGIVATTSKGCVDSSKVSLTIECDPNNIHMPTGFTPDNNGLNDFYYPLTRGMSKIIRFVIYNRLGQLVYERNNFKPNEKRFGWNGIFNGMPQPAGGFVYFVEAECDTGGRVSKRGNFVLVR